MKIRTILSLINRQKIQEIREPDPFWAFISYLFDKKAN